MAKLTPKQQVLLLALLYGERGKGGLGRYALSPEDRTVLELGARERLRWFKMWDEAYEVVGQIFFHSMPVQSLIPRDRIFAIVSHKEIEAWHELTSEDYTRRCESYDLGENLIYLVSEIKRIYCIKCKDETVGVKFNIKNLVKNITPTLRKGLRINKFNSFLDRRSNEAKSFHHLLSNGPGVQLTLFGNVGSGYEYHENSKEPDQLFGCIKTSIVRGWYGEPKMEQIRPLSEKLKKLLLAMNER